jgi:ferritin
MISTKVENAFNGQINAELYSAYLYLSMSAYFEGSNLKGIAQWMRIQAKEEVEHGMKFYDHIVERGGCVSLNQIDTPKTAWKSPLEAFEDAYKHELKVTGMIDKLVEVTAKECDNAGNNFLQWFVEEQVEEEQQTREIAAKLKLINNIPGAMFMLDHQLGKRGKKD